MDYRDFTALAVGHMDELHAFALRLTRSRMEAEDLVHSTYARAFDRWHQLREPAAMRAWLFQILRGLHANQRRSAATGPRTLVLPLDQDGGAAIGEPEAPLGTPDAALATDVEHALARLTDPAREVVLLADLWGFAYAEIGEIMGCPVGTVRSRLHRARAELAETLRDHARERGWGSRVARPRREGKPR